MCVGVAHIFVVSWISLDISFFDIYMCDCDMICHLQIAIAHAFIIWLFQIMFALADVDFV